MNGPLVDHLGRPLAQGRISRASRESGTYRGSISNYRPHRILTSEGEAGERKLTQDRAQDLYANDFAARSAVDAISTNAVGTGLVPQPHLPHKRLNISEEEAADVKDQMEWIWAEWCTQADAAGKMHFEDMQLAGIRSMLRMGELLHLPVMEETGHDGRTFSLAIQALSPKRLRTPEDKSIDPSIRDGVHLSPSGKPLGYWIAAPRPAYASGLDCGGLSTALAASDFRYVPARVAHRPGIFHIFRNDDEEQIRGNSTLSTGVKLFRNLADAIDYELYAQIIAASFPVFFALEGGQSGLPDAVREQYGLPPAENPADKRYYQSVGPGEMLYGNPGEKPEILESKRPSQNFMNFVELILRAQGAASGISYETMFRDFSKSNYSSARAALNEDWKTFFLYRNHFSRMYCQPIWNMVQEEAWLRGRLVLPKNAPDFYAAMFLWCNCYWYGPSRGYIDPVKEIQANVLAISERLMTRHEHFAQYGADFTESMDTIEVEEKRLAAMPKAPDSVAVRSVHLASANDVDNKGDANADV